MLSTVKKLRNPVSQFGPTRPEEASDGELKREVNLRLKVPGYGGATMRAVVPGDDLADILEGSREVRTNLGIRVGGIGTRNVSVRVLPKVPDDPDGRRTVRQEVPGYGSVPTRMTFREV